MSVCSHTLFKCSVECKRERSRAVTVSFCLVMKARNTMRAGASVHIIALGLNDSCPRGTSLAPEMLVSGWQE